MLTAWKESYDQPRQYIKKQRLYLPTKVHLVKAIFFPVVMYGCESWTIKKVECWRLDALELWCWRRRLRVPCTARRSNQSILKEISPGCSLERLMLKLKRQYFGHLMQKADSFWKDPDARKEGGLVKKGTTEDEMVGWHHRLNGHRFGWTPGVGDGQGGLACHGSWVSKSQTSEQLNWTELTWNVPFVSLIFLKRSLVFPILLFSSISLHWWLRKAFLSLFATLWNSAFRWIYISFSPLLFASLLFSAIFKVYSDNHFVFLHFTFFQMVMITDSCTMSGTYDHCSSASLSYLIPWIYHFHCIVVSDLI